MAASDDGASTAAPGDGASRAGTATGRPLRRSVVVAALVVAVVGIFAALAAQDRAAREATAAREGDQITFVVAQAMRASLDQSSRVLDALAAEPGPDGRVGEAAARALAMVPLLASSIDAAAIVDRDGRIVANAGGGAGRSALATIAADAVGALATASGPSVAITASVHDGGSGADLVGLARARRDADGSFAGVALLVIDPAHFDMLKRLPLLCADCRLAVMRRDGMPLFQFPELQFPNRGHGDAGAIAVPPHSAVGSFRSPAAGGGSDLEIHYRSIADVPLTVVYARAQSDILRPWRTLWMANAMLVGVAVAGFLVLGAILARSERREAARELDRRAREAVALRRTMAELAAAALTADEANRAKSRFFAHVTHELRTPLNAIMGFSEVIRGALFGPIENPRYREYAGLIHDAGSHLLSLIDDLLDLAKIEAGKMEIAPLTVSAAALCRSALDLVALLARERGLGVSVSGVETCPDLVVDPRAAKQVLVNLLSNAIKFTPVDGSVALAFHARAEGGVAITVTDTGIGMSEDELRTAFEPFGQVPSELARLHKGTGLGLPLARNLVRLHGGELSVASEKGRGTAVTVIFPVHAPGHAPAHVPAHILANVPAAGPMPSPHPPAPLAAPETRAA